ncbi:MAG: FecR domain-containing protein [Myxococcales bacterium]|nr:FecR domain-containing protein [Myxococcales bacterium]
MWDSEDREYRRFAELMDREALGEALSAEERAFCERVAERDGRARREVELLSALAELDAAPDAQSRQLVDATLARLQGGLQGEQRIEAPDDRGPHAGRGIDRPGTRQQRALWLLAATGLSAAAVMLLLLVHSGTTTSTPEPQAQRPSAPATATAVGPKATRTGAPVVPPSTRMELVYASGEVRVDGAAVVQDSSLLREGSEIEVGQGGACIAMDPQIDICLGADSKLKLSDVHSAARRLDLQRGRAAVQLETQPTGMELSVVADGIISTAVGTAFSVVRDPEQGIATTVLHGKVRVGRVDGAPQNARMVRAHQRAQVRGSETEVAAVSRSDEAPQWALLRPATLWSERVSATLELKGLPPQTRIYLDERLVGEAPLSTLIPAGEHRLEARHGTERLAVRPFRAEAGERVVLDLSTDLAALGQRQRHAQRPAAGVAVERATSQNAVASPAAMLTEARQLMRKQRFAEAAARYQALYEAHPQSPEARTVLVPLAQLQLDRLGRPNVALGNLERYLASGRGALAEEARHTRIRALHQAGRAAQERAAIEEFLRLHPKSFHARAHAQRLTEIDAR